ncbi:MAG: translation initiation factor IF-2 subunit gamma [Candidatus Nanohalarchaeota archaeon]|nr:MAG: translation initiation factor IF-2 subunit gamma [Candidatus Nanohaloarchaeota archaeon]
MSKNFDLNELPCCNIGVVGHVDHGKTTLTSILTGKFTDEHSEELKRGISIRLGYADMQIRKCKKCKPPACWGTTPVCINCFSQTELINTVSFIDAPGHETLMATVLCGASLMDFAILVIAANEKCPQPQTKEHLNALELSGIKNILVVQNKIDLVSPEEALKNYHQIKAFLSGSIYKNVPIIPVSAQYKLNIDALLEKIYETFLKDIQKKTEKGKDPVFLVARSFDVNKPGTKISDLKGAVLGGSIISGELKVGDIIQISPGVDINKKYVPLETKINKIIQSDYSLPKAQCGGLIALETTLDPSLSRSDSLVGNVVGFAGKIPPASETIQINVTYLKREKQIETYIKKGDVAMMNIGTARTVGICTNADNKKNIFNFSLKLPVCILDNQNIAISKQIKGKWSLIAKGSLI